MNIGKEIFTSIKSQNIINARYDQVHVANYLVLIDAVLISLLIYVILISFLINVARISLLIM